MQRATLRSRSGCTTSSPPAPDVRARFGLTLSAVVLDRQAVRREASDGAGLIHDVLRDGRRSCGRPLEEIVNG